MGGNVAEDNTDLSKRAERITKDGEFILLSISVDLWTGAFNDVMTYSYKNFSATDNSAVFEANILKLRAIALLQSFD